MKNLFLIIAMVFIFRPVMPVVEYIVNYDYISKVLCQNIDKPELQCNGKCHVASEFDKALEHKAPVKVEKSVVLFDFIASSSIYISSSAMMFSLKKQVLQLYANLYTFLFSTLLLQPPIF